MVLGILSVMVIMAVAFAIAMRTERVAAGNYADSVRARQLVQVGLARALNDMVVAAQYGLGSNGLSSPGSKVYPDWLAITSYTNGYTNTSANVYLLYATNGSTRANEATNFVPRALWDVATNADYGVPLLNGASNHWVLIESVVQLGTNAPETNRMGRVKYLILNCSGLLDANFAGGVGRGVGASPSELAIGSMPEFSGAATTFLDQRDTGASRYYRYETQAELAELNKTAFNGAPSNFTVYSRALPDYWDAPTTTNKPKVNLAGSVSNLTDPARQNAIITAFTNSGFSLPWAGILFSNLIDYVDENSEPGNLLNCVEVVPMINEIAFHGFTDGPWIKNTVAFELWYPFVSHNYACSPFNLYMNYTISSDGSGYSSNYNKTWSAQNLPILNSLPYIWPMSDYFSETKEPTGALYKITSITVEVRDTNNVVLDRASNLISPIPIPNDSSPTQSIECIDPRFNLNLSDLNQWSGPSVNISPGETNNATKKYWADPINSGCDQDSRMYVNTDLGDHPLKSVGELGYLAYAPWKTIKLYGANLHRVLDYFAIGTNSTDNYVTNAVWRGLVNPNSRETNALAVVFAAMPVDEYRGGPSNSLSMVSALTLAGRLYSGGFYTNLSEIGRGLTNFNGLNGGSGPVTIFSELQRESFFRNAIGLLNVRQNFFTIIIEAQVASGGNIPSHPVKQRAVALVWRDPYTGEMFVRSIKWLKD